MENENLRYKAFNFFFIAATLFLLMALYIDMHHQTRGATLMSVAYGQGSMVLRPNAHNQYLLPGYINNVPVTFLIDTGASSISVNYRIAKLAGLKAYRKVPVNTAAGTVAGYSSEISVLQAGHFLYKNIDAIILPGQGDTVLLGMNALGDLSITQHNGVLSISAPQKNAR